MTGQTVGVLGAGVMGTGVAHQLAQCGFRVVLIDLSEDLLQHACSTQTEIEPGRWVPARPINFRHRSFLQKVREAWEVFKGRAAAFTWPDGQ